MTRVVYSCWLCQPCLDAIEIPSIERQATEFHYPPRTDHRSVCWTDHISHPPPPITLKPILHPVGDCPVDQGSAISKRQGKKNRRDGKMTLRHFVLVKTLVRLLHYTDSQIKITILDQNLGLTCSQALVNHQTEAAGLWKYRMSAFQTNTEQHRHFRAVSSLHQRLPRSNPPPIHKSDN